MSPRTTAVIATRIIGLVMLLSGTAALLGQALPFIEFMFWIRWRPRLILENLSGGGQFGLSANIAVLSLAGALMGWYLVFRGRRVHAWLLAGLGNECPACGYNLRGVTADKCPECGGGITNGGSH